MFDLGPAKDVDAGDEMSTEELGNIRMIMLKALPELKEDKSLHPVLGFFDSCRHYFC
jgi:hypothetical protein